jgi:hypothetical protein
MTSEEKIKELQRRRKQYLTEAATCGNKMWAAFMRGKAAAIEDTIYLLRRWEYK